LARSLRTISASRGKVEELAAGCGGELRVELAEAAVDLFAEAFE
jgi:hypothetical protein